MRLWRTPPMSLSLGWERWAARRCINWPSNRFYLHTEPLQGAAHECWRLRDLGARAETCAVPRGLGFVMKSYPGLTSLCEYGAVPKGTRLLLPLYPALRLRHS